MIDIALINGYRTDHPYLPVGLGYVAQAIEDAGYAYDVLDINLNSESDILMSIKEWNPRFVGLGTMTHQVDKNYALLLAIRQELPDVKIILGGPHTIAAQSKVFDECAAVDIIIQGEGEVSLVKILQGTCLDNIAGVTSRATPTNLLPREFISINSVNFPRYHKFNLAKYGNEMNLASSRGCVYKCNFCGAPKFLGAKWRAFSSGRMIEEFEHWYKKGYKHFYFSDSLFAAKKKRVIEFCDHITNSRYQDVTFTADGLRADNITREVLVAMRKANFESITFGVESVNDKTLVFFNKGESFSQIDAAISIADELGFRISVYLIIGAPGETREDALKSIRYPIKYKNIVSAIYTKLIPIMGTPYFDFLLEKSLINDTACYYPTIEVAGWNARSKTKEISEDIWESLQSEIEKVTRFVNMRNIIMGKAHSIGIRNIPTYIINKISLFADHPLLYTILSAGYNSLKFIIIHWRSIRQRMIFSIIKTE